MAFPVVQRAKDIFNALSWKEWQRRRLAREHERQTIAFHEKHDPEENRRTCPPVEETINLHCAWAVEFYTPAHMDNLAKSLLRFNQTSGAYEHETEYLDNWVNGLHRARYGGGWINLGPLELKGNGSKFMSPTRKVELPDAVDFALAHAFQVSPSIVCIAVCFVFGDLFSLGYDRELRNERKTYTRALRNGHSIITPELQKLDAIRSIRSTISNQATDWFSQHFPGIFASELLGGTVPVCEFVTLQQAKPFLEEEAQGPPQPPYVQLLGLDHYWEAWRHTTIPTLHFSLQDHHRGYPPRYATLSANDHELPDQVSKSP